MPHIEGRRLVIASMAAGIAVAILGAALTWLILRHVFHGDLPPVRNTATVLYILLGGVPLSIYASMAAARLLAAPREGGVTRILPTVSIVIPAYNAESTLGPTLRSIASQDYPADLIEVIVVDDGSTDATRLVASWYMERIPGMRLLAHKVNMGKPAALWTGITAARGDLVVTLDSDTILDRHAISRIVSLLSASPQLGGASGNIVPIASTGGLWRRLQEIEYFVSFEVGRHSMTILYGANPVMSGAFSAFHARMLKSHGRTGIPSDTLAEDFELTVLLWKKGYRTGYAWDAVAYTDIPGSLSGLYRQRLRWFAGGLQVLIKHPHLLRRGGFSRLLAAYLVVVEYLLPILQVAGYTLLAVVIPLHLAIGGILSLPLAWFLEAYASAIAASTILGWSLVTSSLAAIRGPSKAAGLAAHILVYQLFYTLLLSLVKAEAVATVLAGEKVGWK